MRGDAKAAGLIAPKEFNGVRARAVAIDFSVLQQVRDARPTVDRPQTIRIPFFDDASLLVEISAAVPTHSFAVAARRHASSAPAAAPCSG